MFARGLRERRRERSSEAEGKDEDEDEGEGEGGDASLRISAGVARAGLVYALVKLSARRSRRG